MDATHDEHGALYWFLHNLTDTVRGGVRRHWRGLLKALLFVSVVLFLARGFIHPTVMAVRQRSFLVAVLIGLLVVWVWARRRRTWIKVLASAACLAVLAGLLVWGGVAHDYVSLFYRYQTLQIVEMEKLPITGHERLQPLNSIYSLAHEKAATEMESPQRPDFVRINGEYRWTLAVEPAHFLPRFGSVRELQSVSDSVPDFTKRENVNFEVGENMLLGRNSLTATIKSFGLWKYFNYEPVEVRYILDGNNEWVQVVSLVRWTGIFFPRPEFGGVHVIRQVKNPTFLDGIRLMLFGTGEWVRPQDIASQAYLAGQNILPYEVSRYMANSFRFQNGFFGPMPGNHLGDVRIPNLPADVNDQPFTTYFEEVNDRIGMLYHYFALQPFDPEKQGLTVSVWIPADGSGSVYAYRHFQKGDALTGVSAVAARVMDTRKEYDWSRHRPVEHRPFIRDIDGVRRFFWLTTIVTTKDAAEGTAPADSQTAAGAQQWFIAGTSANIVVTDAAINTPVWVSLDPSRWIDEIRAGTPGAKK